MGGIAALAELGRVSGSQVNKLLSDPEMLALLAAVPSLAWALRPLCWMLAVRVPHNIDPAIDLPRGKPPVPAADRVRRGLPKWKWRPGRRVDLLSLVGMDKPIIAFEGGAGNARPYRFNIA